MSTLTGGLVDFLTDALIGAPTVKVYGGRRPQGLRPLPEVLVTRITTGRDYLFCGQDELVQASMQVDNYAIGYNDAELLAKRTRDSLRGARGLFGTVKVDSVFLTNETDALDIEPGCHRVIQTYTFWYYEE